MSQPSPPETRAGASKRLPSHTSKLAVAALVIGILALPAGTVGVAWTVFGLFVGLLGIALSPLAAIMGFVAMRRVASSNGTLKGRGFAVAGLVIGILGGTGDIGLLAFYAYLTQGFRYA